MFPFLSWIFISLGRLERYTSSNGIGHYFKNSCNTWGIILYDSSCVVVKDHKNGFYILELDFVLLWNQFGFNSVQDVLLTSYKWSSQDQCFLFLLLDSVKSSLIPLYRWSMLHPRTSFFLLFLFLTTSRIVQIKSIIIIWVQLKD